MAETLPYIPEGMTAVTPHLVCDDAAAAIAFYIAAFGATEQARMPGPGGKIMHAMIAIDGSTVMLVDEFPEWGVRGPKALGRLPSCTPKARRKAVSPPPPPKPNRCGASRTVWSAPKAIRRSI